MRTNIGIMPFLYLVFSTTSLILSMLGFSLVMKPLTMLFYLILPVLAFLTIIFYYKHTTPHFKYFYAANLLLVITLFNIPSIPLNFYLIMIVSLNLIAFFPLLIMRNFNLFSVFIALIICLFLVAFNLAGLFWFINPIGSTIDKYHESAPNQKYDLVLSEVDQGALGGETIVQVRRYFLGVAKWEKTLYIGEFGEEPEIGWVGESTMTINKHKLNIFKDKWDNRVR